MARNDPYWLTAKFPGKDKNGKPFRKGERVFYYPLTRTFLTGPDAEAAALDFEAHAFDEDFGYRASADDGARFLAKKYGLTTEEAKALAADPRLVDQVEEFREKNGLPHPASALVRGVIWDLIGFERAPRRASVADMAMRVVTKYVQAATAPNTYVMTGNTFANRALMKNVFGPSLVWDAGMKRWLGYGVIGNSSFFSLTRAGVKITVISGRRVEPGESVETTKTAKNVRMGGRVWEEIVKNGVSVFITEVPITVRNKYTGLVDSRRSGTRLFRIAPSGDGKWGVDKYDYMVYVRFIRGEFDTPQEAAEAFARVDLETA